MENLSNRSYSLFEKKFVAGYQFMKVERKGVDAVYRIDWMCCVGKPTHVIL